MLRVAWEYIKGYKKHTMVCVIGIAFSVMLIFSLIGISARIMNQYHQMVDEMINVYDMRVSGLDSDTLETIYNQVDAEAEISMRGESLGTIYQEDGSFIFPMGVKGDWKEFYKIQLLEGTDPVHEYEICVEDKFAQKNGIKIGQQLSYKLLDDDGKEFEVSFVVTGIVEDTKFIMIVV